MLMTQPHVALEVWADWQIHHDTGHLPTRLAMKGSPMEAFMTCQSQVNEI